MTITAVIVSYQSALLLIPCVSALLAAAPTARALQVVVVDVTPDGSDGAALLGRPLDARVSVIHSENRGFGAACNHGAKASRGDILLFLNADIAIDPGALDALAAAFQEDPSLGVTGFRLREDSRDPAPCRFKFPHAPHWVLLNLIRHRHPTRARATCLNLPVDGAVPLGVLPTGPPTLNLRNPVRSLTPRALLDSVACRCF